MRLEAHDLAYETSGLGYGTLALGTGHVIDVGHVVVVLLVVVFGRSRLLSASAASGLAI